MKLAAAEPDQRTIGIMMRVVIGLAFLAAFTVPTGIIPIIAVGSSEVAAGISRPAPAIIPLAGPTPVGTLVAVDPTPSVPRIGIIAGHTGSDSGAVCPDGLQEVDINTEIARRVVAQLMQRGWQVDLLEEFDEDLNGYRADALLSIHADSCTYPGKTGFKVARAESSYVPNDEDRLVNCLSTAYQARTGLAFDANTITFDMTRYHAYYEIDQNTPAAIIEVGFMLDDRELLVEHPELVAQGIVEGLVCFIEGEPAPQ
ncbi:MAG: N-acetylmuramoyl-L-alanine amidase [Anaerolineae bacterium]|jgi:N-acetylmuramoyl-L-alanine amidase|nr:N-acetylmuramoyl-L-alanine amidase [Anaerolineae bacterium]